MKTNKKIFNTSTHIKKNASFFLLNELQFMLRQLVLLNGKVLFINTSSDEEDASFVTRTLAQKYNHLYIVRYWLSGAVTNNMIIRARYSLFDDDLSNFFYWPHLVFLLNVKENKVCLNELRKYKIPIMGIVTNQQYISNQQLIKYPIFSTSSDLVATMYYYNRYILELMTFFQRQNKHKLHI